jgi:aminopeptidase N
MKRRPAWFVAVFLLLLPASAQAQRQWIEAGPTPLRYEISVAPNAEAATFDGEVSIAIEVAGPTDAITLNAVDMTIADAEIDGRNVRFALDQDAQTLTLTPRRPLPAGRHVIEIEYAGVIYDEAYGLFRVSYDDHGRERRALATQFEPGDARRFAPMWDQPDRRAVFSLTVTAPTDQMVIGNMPVESTTTLPRGFTRTRFADSPPMPSYLLFLGVGDFERVTRDVDGVELGVVVRRGEAHRTTEALDAGEQSLRYYAEYFGEPYPLPKLDMIGVPGAGGFGAMENWGAILYFDQYLLVDENSSETERQNVFGFVAHEIAHQWFGDLVTMAWWDDLWLNEGFASWMAAKATERWHPDWNPWLAQLTNGTSRAMSLDSRVGTHPIVQTVNTIDEANLAFDAITYEKGLAVIRMIEAYAGEDAFRQGVRDYIGSHRYGNARTEDLWRSIQAASGQPVLSIARSFTTQPGFPMISTASAPCVSRRNRTIELRQRRFAMDDISRTNEVWEIPIVIRHGGQTDRTVFPAMPWMPLQTEGCQPYLINAGQTGFFRVRYDAANLQRLRTNFASLSDADQLGLLLDYWAFAQSGDASYTDYLQLMEALPADADPIIVTDIANALKGLADYASERPSDAAIRAYGREILAPYFARAGWNPREGENSNQLAMRATLIETLGELGDEQVIAEARRRVHDADMPSSLRAAILSVYADSATPTDFDALLAQARAAPDFVEKRRIWRLAAGVADPALARRMLDLSLGEDVPRQIRTQLIRAVASEHPRMAWDFIRAHRADVEALLDPLQRLEFPAIIAGTNSDPAVADELEAYAADFPQGARPTVEAAKSQIRIRAQTINERFPAVERWVAARVR